MDGMNRYLLGLKPITEQSKVIDNIINECAEVFETSADIIKGTTRHRWESVYPRQCAMYLIKKKYPKITYQDLASHFRGSGTVINNKNHATVMHGIKSVENLLHFKWGDNTFIDKYDNVVRNLDIKFGININNTILAEYSY